VYTLSGIENISKCIGKVLDISIFSSAFRPPLNKDSHLPSRYSSYKTIGLCHIDFEMCLLHKIYASPLSNLLPVEDG